MTLIDRQPCYARCLKCEHTWVFAYLPMPEGPFDRVMKHSTCPMCASTTRHHAFSDPGRPFTDDAAALKLIDDADLWTIAEISASPGGALRAMRNLQATLRRRLPQIAPNGEVR